jgi:CHAD domain-containing protein
MKDVRLYRRWRKRAAKLLDLIRELFRQAKAEGAPEQIHQLRVNIRRLRLYHRLGKRLLPRKALAAFRQWSRSVLENTGSVRDHDVALELLGSSGAAQAWLERVQARRQRLWQARRRGLRPLPTAVVKKPSPSARARKAAKALQKRFLRQQARFEDQTRQQTPKFFDLGDEERHEFRRTLRWWRYLRELILSLKEQKRDPLLKRLIAVQESTGEHQNRASALCILNRWKPTPELETFRQRITEEQEDWNVKSRRNLRALAKRQGWTAKPSKRAGQGAG